MRILFPICNYFPHRWGGTEVYVHGLVTALMERGHHITIVTDLPESEAVTQYHSRVFGKWYEHDGAQVFGVHITSRGGFNGKYENHRGRYEGVEAFWLDWLDEHPFDLVHFHSLSPVASNSLMYAAKRQGLPVVFSYHLPTTCPMGTWKNWRGEQCDGELRKARCFRCVLEQHSGSGAVGLLAEFVPLSIWQTTANFMRWTDNRLGKVGTALQMPILLDLQIERLKEESAWVDLWHVQSYQGYEVLRRNGIPENRLYLLRHGLEEPDLRKPSNRPRFPHAPLRLGYIGRLSTLKGVETLLRAFVQLSHDSLVELLLYTAPQDAGEEVYKNSLQQIVRDDPRVHWKGSFPRNTLRDVLAEIDILVVPSEYVEIGPQTVHEAFAAGVPVIGSNWSGIPELVTHDKDGLLFEKGNPNVLAAQIRRLLDDPSLLRRLQSGITPRVSMKEVAEAMERQYLRLIQPSREKQQNGYALFTTQNSLSL